ncbi:MAG: MGMT family protein [Bacteroidetes bacterium]|nr:MGMT family protein [Bacteroidota bacterium]
MKDEILHKKSRKDFDERVYQIVMQIPYGKVTTYGHIASSLGSRKSSRMVGYALNYVKDRITIPCHRVINRNGELSGKLHFATPTLMRELLEAEGIEFNGDTVNLMKHLWIPPIE